MVLTESYKGWSKKRDSLLQLVSRINDNYGQVLFDLDQVKEIEKLSLYSVEVKLHSDVVVNFEFEVVSENPIE